MKLLSVLFVSLLFISFGAFAQVTEVMPSGDFFELFLASLGGLQGAGTLGILLIVLKLLFHFLQSELAGKIGFLRDMGPGTKLFVILCISYVSGILTLMTTGLSFGAAAIHSTSMSALIVLMNQAYKKFVK